MALKTITIGGSLSEARALSAAATRYVLQPSLTVSPSTGQMPSALVLEAGANRAQLVIGGSVAAYSGQEGIRMDGEAQRVDISKGADVTGTIAIHAADDLRKMTAFNHGTITSKSGIVAEGENTRARIANDGVIEAGLVGICSMGDRSSLLNSGRISAPGADGQQGHGIEVAGRFSRVVNTASGEISGAVGIHSGDGHAGETVRILNAGSLTGSVAAIASGDANIELINKGVLSGAILLGSGDDRLNLARGSITASQIAGGKGDDFYRIAATTLPLAELADEGNDTVSIVGGLTNGQSFTLGEHFENLILAKKLLANAIGNNLDNQIDGSARNNNLSGLDGNDVLDGWRGRDTLTGGTGADTFVFAKGNGKDVVTDFEQGLDHIELQRFAASFDSPDEILAVARQSGSDVVFTFAPKDVLTILNADLTGFDAADFTWF